MLHDEGGSGSPILLLHGLMGSSRTWHRQLGWLREYGRVYTFDAAGHGRPAPDRIATEAFVTDIAAATADIPGPMVVIGHSMGGLHGWMFAAAHHERVRGIVVEDMAPDFRGRTAVYWAEMVRSWPQPFRDGRAVLEYFGPVAGRYFLDAFTHGPDGYRLHGDIDVFRAISEEWGMRDFWSYWSAVRCPALLVEGEHTITPDGQMLDMARRHRAARHVRIPDAGHLVHDDQPDSYRKVVADFLLSLHRQG